jgi:hypothetical protein
MCFSVSTECILKSLKTGGVMPPEIFEHAIGFYLET